MKTSNGFTLIEIAIVLMIVALVFGSGLSILSVQQDQLRINDTKILLDDANEALIGYALTHTTVDGKPYLPCPDRMTGTGANDGQEDRTAGICAVQEGNLPWVTLGMTSQTDTWSNRLRYRVAAVFSNSNSGMHLGATPTTGDINVLDAAAGNTIVTNVPAIILSHGRNGWGAVNTFGVANPAPPTTNVDELANTDVNITFIRHYLSTEDMVGGAFDDQIIWLSPYTLYNRMIQAGKTL